MIVDTGLRHGVTQVQEPNLVIFSDNLHYLQWISNSLQSFSSCKDTINHQIFLFSGKFKTIEQSRRIIEDPTAALSVTSTVFSILKHFSKLVNWLSPVNKNKTQKLKVKQYKNSFTEVIDDKHGPPRVIKQ